MGRCSSFVKLCFALWMIFDMITDCMATYSRYVRCQDGEIPCGYFWSSLVFLFLPWALAILVAFVIKTERADWFWILIFYPVALPAKALAISGRGLFLGEDDRCDSQAVTYYKLVEHIGEAFPQLVISCALIHSTGGAAANLLDTVSAVMSAMSFVLGFTTGAAVWIWHHVLAGLRPTG